MQSTARPISFAVAVPVGAWHPFLPDALASLARQDAAVQVALLDASDDPRVAQAADESGLQFAYRRHGPDEGQAAAIEEGWAHTDADVVFWLNVDDRLSDDALALIAHAFTDEPQTDVVFGGSDFLDRNGQTIGSHGQVADVTALILRSNTISQPSCFARRRVVEAVGGVDTRLHFVMDWDLWVRLYQNGCKFKRLDATLSHVFMGADTKTALVSFQRLSEVFRLVCRNAGLWAAIKSTLSVFSETMRQRGAPRDR